MNAASLDSLTPDNANQGQTTTVDFAGTNTLWSGVTPPDVDMGTGIAVNSIAGGATDTAFTANVTVAEGAPATVRDVTVTTGGQTNTKTDGFTVNNPVPTTTGIVPSSTIDGSGAFTLIVKGTNFVNTSKVRWNGSNRATTFVSSTRLTAAITAADVQNVGTAAVTVFNPAPGGGLSNAQTFTIEYPTPTVKGMTPDGGSNSETVSITNLEGTNFRNGATVKLIGPSGSGETGAGTIDATNVNVASSTKITCDFDLNGATAGSYDVKVTNNNGKSGSKANAFTVNEAEVKTPTWYLAEGTTAWGFDCYMSIENPNSQDLTAEITYMTDTGPISGGTVDLAASSQTIVRPGEQLGEKDFSTRVECVEGQSIAVDRTMHWRGEGANSPGAHCSIGVTAPAKTWCLPEGSSDWGFECWLLIQNPNEEEATCYVTYMIEGGDPQTFEKKIPANSRKTYNMVDDIGVKDASIKVDSDIPVIPERAMYRNNRREGHESIGATTAANDYYLAEGTTGWGFKTYVLVQNPHDSVTEVNVTYMTSSGPVPDPNNPINMPANSRHTISVNEVLPEKDFSTHVHGSQEIIAERAMYWGEGTEAGEASHDSIGLAEPHRKFYLPDGQTSGGWETWTLVQNPNDTDVNIKVSYLTPSGVDNDEFDDTIPANSRKTYDMADRLPDSTASIMVECTTPGKKVIAERAMYWFNRGAGTSTIGGFSD